MIGRYIATMLLALVSLTGWSADATVTIDDALTHGSITSSTSGSKVTLTAKPDANYFLNFDDLSVKAYTDAGGADGRQRAPIPMYTIDVTNNGDGTYSFTMPTEGYDVYVTAVFSQVTVTLPTGPYTYNGTAQTPTPTVKIGSTSLTASTEYTVGYSANTNVGTATVTVSGAGKYFGTATASFTIGKATLTVKANDMEMEIGSSDPTLTYTVSGLQGTDTEESVMSGALARDKGDALGNYAISLGTLTAGNNYTISFTGATLSIYRMLNGLFSGENEWATFTWSENLALPAGITAYIIKAVSEGTAEATALTYIPQKVPVMLKRSDTSVNSYKAYAGTGTDDVSGNLLAGSDADDTTIVPYQDYVLYNDLFVLAGVSTVGATHAYLPAKVIGSQAAARLTINATGDPVGIDEIRIQELQDVTGWYTLNGRKLGTVPTKKGLYIKDGRKVVIK